MPHPTRRRKTPKALATLLVPLTLILTLTGCEDGKGLRDEGPSTSTTLPAGPNEPRASEQPRQPSR